MDKKLIRTWIDIDIDDCADHLLVVGDLLASCAKCSALDLKTDAKSCPKCETVFKYIAFRNPEENIRKMLKMRAENKDLVFIDYADFKKITGSMKARKFFK
jgi:hypothetical protein